MEVTVGSPSAEHCATPRSDHTRSAAVADGARGESTALSASCRTLARTSEVAAWTMRAHARAMLRWYRVLGVRGLSRLRR